MLTMPDRIPNTAAIATACAHGGLAFEAERDVLPDASCAGLDAALSTALRSEQPITVRPGLRVAFLRAPEGVSIELLDRNAKM